ncbi:unnamed protein product, partial [Onchocerca ochengi]|uniref:Integrase_H2C2 domain-containing protein n=1 Tax=Onchocerca ochengi TaxID=42157 RepID=A0A182EY69_ONCOC
MLLIKQAQTEGIIEEEIDKWDLFYDEEDRVWRLRGRLRNSELESCSLHPINLPAHNPVTEIFIQREHEELYHAGAAHTLSKLRTEFWIPKGRTEVKRIVNKCMACRRWKARPFKLPIMPGLPDTRVKRSRTFE